jgi:hypothetical protein
MVAKVLEEAVWLVAALEHVEYDTELQVVWLVAALEHLECEAAVLAQST